MRMWYNTAIMLNSVHIIKNDFENLILKTFSVLICTVVKYLLLVVNSFLIATVLNLNAALKWCFVHIFVSTRRESKSTAPEKQEQRVFKY